MLEIKCFEFGPFGTNTYVVSTDAGIILIDPACSNQYEQQVLYNYINSSLSGAKHSVIPSLIIVATHGHLDHLWGAAWATEQWHTPVLMHEADIPMAKDMQSQYDLFGIRATPQPFPVEPLNSQLSTFNSQLKIILVQEGQQDTGGNSRTHHAGHIGTHGVLEEVVGLVVFEAYVVRHTGGVGHCADA